MDVSVGKVVVLAVPLQAATSRAKAVKVTGRRMRFTASECNPVKALRHTQSAPIRCTA